MSGTAVGDTLDSDLLLSTGVGMWLLSGLVRFNQSSVLQPPTGLKARPCTRLAGLSNLASTAFDPAFSSGSPSVRSFA